MKLGEIIVVIKKGDLSERLASRDVHSSFQTQSRLKKKNKHKETRFQKNVHKHFSHTTCPLKSVVVLHVSLFVLIISQGSVSIVLCGFFFFRGG